jgi:hypothetical protein
MSAAASMSVLVKSRFMFPGIRFRFASESGHRASHTGCVRKVRQKQYFARLGEKAANRGGL